MSKFIPFLLLFNWATPALGQAFITTWDTRSVGVSLDNQITIPTVGIGYNYSIYWEEINNAANNATIPGPITGNYTITFPKEGIYKVSITGNFPRIYFNDLSSSRSYPNNFPTSDAQKLKSIEQWGINTWTSMSHAFEGCVWLKINAGDSPNLSQVTDMSYMFSYAVFSTINSSIGLWDVSNVNNMSYMFQNADLFNQSLENWDVRKVTDMSWMFYDSDRFDQSLENWDVSGVTNMSHMFHNAWTFNQSLEAWDVSNVVNMSSMFQEAIFNQPLGKWSITSVSNMDYMLSGSGLDLNNYDQTLIGWASQNVLANVPLGSHGLRYCAGEQARMQLINNKGWKITGDNKSNEALQPPAIHLIHPLCRDSTGTIEVMTLQTGDELYSFDNGITFQKENRKAGLQPGTYTVLYYRNNIGCSSASATVVINAPSIPITPGLSGSPVVCPNVVGVDYQASIENYTYEWFVNGGVINSKTKDKIKVDWGPTNFNAAVKAVGYNQDNCPTDTVTFPVKIQVQLQPEIISGLDSVCFNFRNGVSYESSYTNGSTYTWFSDGGVVSGGQTTSSAKMDWLGLGKYNLWVKEENTSSTDYCEGFSDTLQVTVFKDMAAITMNFVSVDYKDEKKVKVQWDASLLERISDLIVVSRRIAGSNDPWIVLGTFQKNIQSFLDQNVSTDQNIYEYKIEGFNKCEEGLQTVVHNTIKLAGDKVEEQELIDLFWNDYNGWEGVERYEIWRKLDGDSTYRLLDVTNGGVTNYAGKYGGDGFNHVFRIKARKKNENIISWSNEIELDFENPIDLIPNVITPNGDTENEYFFIPKLDLYPENSLKIINRWGEQVYEKINYTNDWNANGLQTGVYYYSLYLVRNKKRMNGWVQVLK